MDGVVRFTYPMQKIQTGIDVVSFLAETGCFPSKGEARKMIQQGGVSLNRHKVEDVNQQVNATHFLHGEYILVQKGKKNYFLIQAV
jgi:tyrosyl-tRNA synthetase